MLLERKNGNGSLKKMALYKVSFVRLLHHKLLLLNFIGISPLKLGKMVLSHLFLLSSDVVLFNGGLCKTKNNEGFLNSG